MKNRKSTMKRGGAAEVDGEYVASPLATSSSATDDAVAKWEVAAAGRAAGAVARAAAAKGVGMYEAKINALSNIVEPLGLEGGSKRKSRKSRKSRKTKKGRGAYEGGKKKCPKHCRRKTRRTRKGFKHRKN